MKRQLNDCIALATLEATFVSLTDRLREWLKGGAKGRSADRIQLTADLNRPVFPHAQLQAAALDCNAMILLDAFRVERVA